MTSASSPASRSGLQEPFAAMVRYGSRRASGTNAVLRRRTVDPHLGKRRQRVAERDELAARLAAAAQETDRLGVRRCQMAGPDARRDTGAEHVEVVAGHQCEKLAITIVEQQVDVG